MQILSIKRKKRIHAIAFSPSGRNLAAACGDGQLRLWDLTTGEVQQSIPIAETSCGYDIVFLGEDRLLFAGVGMRWWDIPANGWNLIAPEMSWARQISLSPDGHFLAEADQATSTDWGGSGLRLFETATWQQQPLSESSRFTTGSIAFSPDGRWLATGHIVRVGDRRRLYNLERFYGHLQRVGQYSGCPEAHSPLRR